MKLINLYSKVFILKLLLKALLKVVDSSVQVVGPSSCISGFSLKKCQ